MTFEQWMARVNGYLVEICGLGVDDLGDWTYRDDFDAGVDPRDTAAEVLADNGFGD